MTRPPDLAELRAAFWTLRAATRARRDVARGGIEAVSLPRVPPVGMQASRGVVGVLRRTSHTCLVQATVRQAWLAAHGQRRDLIIGVKGPAAELEAHAWIDGDPPCHSEGFRELHRRPPPAWPSAGDGV